MNFAFTKLYYTNSSIDLISVGVGNSNGSGKLKRIKFSFLSLRFSHPWKRKYKEKPQKVILTTYYCQNFPDEE